MRDILCVVLATILLLSTFDTPSAAQPGFTLHPLLQTTTTLTDQPLEFSHFRNQVAAVLTELPAGGRTGTMTLFFPSVVYLIEGLLSLEVPGEAARTISAGHALAAPLRTPFNSANQGATSAKFLTVYFGEQGKPFVERASDSAPRGLKTVTVLQTAKTWTGELILFPLMANQFTVLTVDLAPGAVNPRHIHPPTQFIYVLEGALTIEPSEHPRQAFNPGDAFVETTIPHSGGNRGTAGVRILTIYAGEAGVPLNVPVP
jgi:quercetin dioxygenase-like cupin family protein